ncbi:MAG: type II toxin-antitoxin system HicA family toxin [Chthoniobacterales bacterium]
MPRRKQFSGDSICALLGQHGFTAVRQKGSHRVMQKKTVAGTITVPVPMHRDLKPGTLSSIIRQSQLDRSVFQS